MWKARFEILFRRHYGRLEPHLKRKVKEAIRKLYLRRIRQILENKKEVI